MDLTWLVLVQGESREGHMVNGRVHGEWPGVDLTWPVQGESREGHMVNGQVWISRGWSLYRVRVVRATW